MLIDTHCHLDFPELAEQREALFARAKEAGVERMITIGTHKSRFADYLAIANQYPHVFCTLGVHPHETAEECEDVTAAELINAVNQNPKVVGIGETGLDYYYDYSDRTFQKKLFAEHIEAAQETGLPLIIHNRESDDDMIEMLTAAYKRKPMNGLLHCFSSSARLAAAALDIGFYLSFSGILTFKNAAEVQAVAKDAPADRILVETDSPYLAPVPKRGKTNEPSFVAYTAKFLAELRGVTEAEIADITTKNAKNIFKRMV